ncbi:hypothetical protein [Asanoa siamensis]|uniref:hypothetical protein n=1 Tax=Asanoa siamensis TaxID=926357 RepID=UPI001945A025|nr:hypothetical protein [Asanoa siamensis]
MKSIAPNPRNLREEWEYLTDEFAEFRHNVESTDELIQDPAVASVNAYVAKYPQYNGAFGPDVEWVLLAGERRYRAQLDLLTPEGKIAVVLRNKLVEQGDFVLLSENGYRKGWDLIQEAQLIDRIRREEGLTYDQILERLGGHPAIKRRSDISKRVALLVLEDGPLRRSIRQGEPGLEPSYLLVTKLKTQERIEEGWALMQAKGITAKAACEILLGETPTAAEVAENPTPAGAGPSSPTASGPDAGLGHAETAGQEQAAATGPAETSGRDRTAGKEGAGFVDETSAGDESRVPAQARPGKLVPRPVGRWAGADLVAGRIDSCVKVVESQTWPKLDDATRFVVVHSILEASAPALDLALQITGGPAESGGDRLSYVADLEASEDGVLRMAYAIALATDELSLRAAGDRLDDRAAGYLARLQSGAGYDTTDYQQALLAVSSTKL